MISDLMVRLWEMNSSSYRTFAATFMAAAGPIIRHYRLHTAAFVSAVAIFWLPRSPASMRGEMWERGVGAVFVSAFAVFWLGTKRFEWLETSCVSTQATTPELEISGVPTPATAPEVETSGASTPARATEVETSSVSIPATAPEVETAGVSTPATAPEMQLARGMQSADADEPSTESSGEDGEAKWVAWVSVNPRDGQISVYPAEVGLCIEAAHQRGDSSVNLGPLFFRAVVIFSLEGPEQRTGGGRRDVRRIALSAPDASCRVLVYRGRRAWRVTERAGGRAEERFAVVPSGAAVDVKGVATAMAASTDFSLPQVDLEEQEQAGLGNNIVAAEGTEPLWEWCKELGSGVAFAPSLPDSAWGVYGEEQQIEIEHAFAGSEQHAQISVGIRTYKIKFGPEPGFAWQKDIALHKTRLVRRRLVGQQDRLLLLRPVVPVAMREQEVCAICCISFVETATVPALELPGCGHTFHGACVQQLMDAGSPCPCCRQLVDWQAAVLLGLR